MKCDTCNKKLRVGEWPWCPHGKPTPSKGFEPYFDIGLGAQINTPGDRNKLLRPKWNNDYIEHTQPTDKPASHYRELRQKIEAKQRGEL